MFLNLFSDYEKKYHCIDLSRYIFHEIIIENLILLNNKIKNILESRIILVLYNIYTQKYVVLK